MAEIIPFGPPELMEPDDEEWQTLSAAADEIPKHVAVALQLMPTITRTLNKPKRATLRDASVAIMKPTRQLDRDATIGDRSMARQSINEQVAGRLGLLLGAPVAEPLIIEVRTATNQSQLGRANFAPLGFHHGSRRINELAKTHKPEISNEWHGISPGENRERFARLAILYGLCHCPGDLNSPSTGVALARSGRLTMGFSSDFLRWWNKGNGFTMRGGQVRRLPIYLVLGRIQY